MGKAKNLSVLMNGASVGWLARSAKGIVSFGYDENWLSNRNFWTLLAWLRSWACFWALTDPPCGPDRLYDFSGAFLDTGGH